MNRQQLTEKLDIVVAELVRKKGYVSLADVFMNLGYLDHGDYEKWRMRRIFDLERVIKVNLSKINFIIRIVRRIAMNRGLRPSRTEYRSWGKGKKTRLRFSKSGKEAIESTYATHFISARKDKDAEPGRRGNVG